MPRGGLCRVRAVYSRATGHGPGAAAQVLGQFFVSHGSPMVALGDNPVRAAWAELGERIAALAPEVLILVSAHWDTPTVRVGGAPHLATLHDFYGFPETLYQLRHDRDGAPGPAQDMVRQLQARDVPASLDRTRGLDHGAWMPLRDMPALELLPVVPVSVQSRSGSRGALELGAALQRAAPERSVVLASGSIVHNLGRLSPQEQAAVQPWAEDFRNQVIDSLLTGNRQGLVQIAESTAFAQAHPSLEHWLPLLVAAGVARRPQPAELLYSDWTHGSLPMDVLAL